MVSVGGGLRGELLVKYTVAPMKISLICFNWIALRYGHVIWQGFRCISILFILVKNDIILQLFELEYKMSRLFYPILLCCDYTLANTDGHVR